MVAACVFCGSAGKLTKEHVFGAWLGRIGLDVEPAVHHAGWLNRIGRDLGVRRPFEQTVQDVCGACNHGWMSALEVVAQRVLTPLILGGSGEIKVADQAAVAAWAQKTALTAMLVSSERERAEGYGVPAAEYHELYALRDDPTPLPASQFWVGQYDGVRMCSARVTPLAVHVDGLPDPDRPQGYAMTMALGQLVLHGARFTTPSLQVNLSTREGLPQLWPPTSSITWPSGTPLDDGTFLGFAGAKDLCSSEEHIVVRPWTPATELAPSRRVGSMVELPTICGEHVVHYPTALVNEAMQGRFYIFERACECPKAYLIQTEPDGAHCKAADTAEVIGQLYDTLPGEEYVVEDAYDVFYCKRLPGQSRP